jgi:hypothetical protein
MGTFGVNFHEVSTKGGLLASERSWQEAFAKDELFGGPSPAGNSKWSDFVRCPRRYYWAHVKRFTTTELSGPLELGGLVHEAIAQAFEAWVAEGPLAFWDRLWGVIDRAAEPAPSTASEARRLLRAWGKFWGPEGLLKIRAACLLSIEGLVEVTRPFNYSTRIDTVMRIGGMVTVVEHKTASRRSTILLDSYKLNPQFLGQVWLWNQSDFAREHGKIQAFMVDQIVKHQGDVLCYQETVNIPPKMLKDWELSMKAIAKEKTDCEYSNVWPQRFHNCTAYNRVCRFMNLCLHGDKTGLVKKKKGDF